MLRPVWIAAIVLLALPATSAAKRCETLRGRDLAPDRSVKLVRQGNGLGGTNLLGCVLPRGRVRFVEGSSDAETSVDSYRLRAVAGAIVLTRSGSSSQYGFGERLAVTDLRSGRRYTIAHRGQMLGDDGPPPPPLPATALIDRRGRAAALFGQTLAGFSPRGRRVDLATGPIAPASLKLRRGRARWLTAQGQPASAALPR